MHMLPSLLSSIWPFFDKSTFHYHVGLSYLLPQHTLMAACQERMCISSLFESEGIEVSDFRISSRPDVLP